MVSSDFASVLLIAIGLSADCFAVAVSGSASMGTSSTSQVLRISLAFGVSQALMPVFGWLAGRTVIDLIADFDHWIAFALLAVIGGKMIWESFHAKYSRSDATDITRGFPLLALSVATSIDALAVGLTFAFLEVNIATASATIGIVAFTVTAIGFLLGRKADNLIGKRAETIGGIVLIGIGLRIVLTHIL
ncbi:MAG: manganese efflux pump MntP family protein [Dehalococcoidia bacterium]